MSEQYRIGKSGCGWSVWTDRGIYVAEFIHESDAARFVAGENEIEQLKSVVKDYGDQIIERRRLDEAAERLSGQPHAWIVECPRGHEFDSLVFPEKADADDQASIFNEQCPEGESPHVAVPLYAVLFVAGEKAVEACRSQIAEAISSIESLNRQLESTGIEFGSLVCAIESMKRADSALSALSTEGTKHE